MKHVPPPSGEPVEGLENLAMAVPAKWGEAILRLAKATERVAVKLDELPADKADIQYIPKARELAKSLIDFLDGPEDTDQDTACDDQACDDNELDGPENEEDEESDPPEPSLGSIERHPSIYGNPDGYSPTGDQTEWASGGRADMEDEHDGAEPSEDAEPSLGWTTSGVLGGLTDCELDNCDREPSLGWTENGQIGNGDDRERA